MLPGLGGLCLLADAEDSGLAQCRRPQLQCSLLQISLWPLLCSHPETQPVLPTGACWLESRGQNPGSVAGWGHGPKKDSVSSRDW